MGKVKSVKKSSRAVDTTPLPNTNQPGGFAFDATKTLTGLRNLAKKRDPELRAKTLKAYKDHLKSPPKEQPVPATAPSLSFKSSLPVRLTPEAQNRIKQLKRGGAKKILFPPIMQGGEKVMFLDKTGKEQLLGLISKEAVEVEIDPKKMNISHVGLFVKVAKRGKKDLLEFVIKTPGLPLILRSRKLNDQGGLTHQLKISQLYGKKGGK